MKKECSVILLPTGNKSLIGFDLNGKIFPINQANQWAVHQHLYICSNDQITDEDYVFITGAGDEGLVGKKKDVLVRATKEFPHLKVIATTDRELLYYSGNDFRGRQYDAQYQLPSIPQSFIQHYIEQYNKGNKIEKVSVEYEMGWDYEVDHKNNKPDIPKLNGNEIIIVERLKLYNKNQLIVDYNSSLLLKAESFHSGPYIKVSEITKWLKSL